MHGAFGFLHKGELALAKQVDADEVFKLDYLTWPLATRFARG